MYIITVLPIARGINKETLTYFSVDDAPLGSIVTVPLRKKTVSAIVVGVEKAENMKTELKNLPFVVKKMQLIRTDSFFAEYFLKAVAEASIYFCATEGSLVGSLVSKNILELTNEKEEEKLVEKNSSPKKIDSSRRFEELAIQTEEEERVDIYKSIVREAFAKKESVFICLPTEEIAKNILEKLKKGIDEYSVLWSANLGAKKFKDAIKKIKENPHPLLVVGTSSYLPIMREDTKTIILEQESSRFYKQRERPYLDLREFLKIFAKHFKAKIIYADTLLRIETLFRIRQGEIAEYSRIMAKRHKNVKTLVVDTKIEKVEEEDIQKKAQEKKVFQILSPELKEMILYARKHKKSIFLFVSRRGLSSQTICRDCGKTVLCQSCTAPVVLHNQSDGRNFICHHCGEKRTAEELCKYCGSWRLESFGIGIEKVSEAIEELGIIAIQKIDSDSCPTPQKANKVAMQFKEKGGILLGTEMALQYLEEGSADYSAIASFDSLFSLPDFRIEERIMHLIISVKAIARENFLLQGRNTEHKIVELATSGDLANFAKYELESRKKFHLPPFMILVKITVLGIKDYVKEETTRIAEILLDYHPKIFPAFIRTVKGKTMTHMLIKISPNSWPDKKLRSLLISLPPSVSVRVDPESLL